MTLRSLSLALIGLSFSPTILAQDFSCGASGLENMQSLINGRADRLAEIELAVLQLEQFTQQYEAIPADQRGGNQYVVPVVFHIIHNNGPENITDEQVEEAVERINDDFNKQNPEWPNARPEFQDIIADVGITFKLAGLDPDGNCTKGITRTVSELTNDGGQDMKDLIQWPRDQYLNIWVAAYANGAAAYAQYPSSVDSPWAAGADGIVTLHTYVGTTGTSSLSHGHTLSHEIGHWLNLRHCWGNSNEPGLPENCSLSDNVSDTPPTEGWTSCSLSGATCGSPLDNVENFMEYSYCGKMFTEGQKTRMIAALNSGTADRENLSTNSNLELTGTSDPQNLCAAAFTSDKKIICVGGSVAFNDDSYHGASTWEWNLQGAQPPTSTEEDPLVTYDAPGVYTVGLTAGNGQTTVETSVDDYITVLPSPGVAAPYAEDFEGMTAFPELEWIPSNPDDSNNKWELRTNAGFSGTNSIRMRNWGNDVGQVDEIYSTTIDMSQATNIAFSFRYAFARRNSTNDDVLRVYVSSDCGEVWSMRKQLKGSTTLPTVNDLNSAFTPSNETQWQLCEFTNISTAFHVQDFRFKFWFQSDGGNDLWIDDINVVASPVGIDEISLGEAAGLQVIPNPVTGEGATAVIDLEGVGDARVVIIDATGRTVYTADRNAVAGNNRWALPVGDLSSGVYLLRVEHDGKRYSSRFTHQ